VPFALCSIFSIYGHFSVFEWDDIFLLENVEKFENIFIWVCHYVW
jgi:hypothetical protein